MLLAGAIGGSVTGRYGEQGKQRSWGCHERHMGAIAPVDNVSAQKVWNSNH
ncbi:hypothetical protein CP97_14814 [Aurantiacibacter atlanticus]|uniref:Uncharacterized protein n=1 Tax=Aurantiacibacter atlanticus TaxID=1648404 RepID=A0A161IUD3_9SPHN|nr:hypothetical protein CP97_14814 [Aurantiacibacter atlanticus]